MPKKYSYKLWDSSDEQAECWHCQEPTLYFITNLKTGEECFCCPICAIKHYKLKKIVARLKNYSQKQKSFKIKPILHIKNPLNCIQEQGSEHQGVLE